MSCITPQVREGSSLRQLIPDRHLDIEHVGVRAALRHVWIDNSGGRWTRTTPGARL